MGCLSFSMQVRFEGRTSHGESTGCIRLHCQAKHLLPSGPNFVPKVFSTADLAPRGEEQDMIRKNKLFFHLQQSQDFHRQI